VKPKISAKPSANPSTSPSSSAPVLSVTNRPTTSPAAPKSPQWPSWQQAAANVHSNKRNQKHFEKKEKVNEDEMK